VKIQDAIHAAKDGDTILAKHGDCDESIILEQEKSIQLSGGRDDAFERTALFSRANAMRIKKGTLIVEGLRLCGE
jgi:hypothetical protein